MVCQINLTKKLLTTIEDAIMSALIDKEGYLNVGRQTSDNERKIYFACKEYWKSSEVLYEIQEKYSENFEIDYQIYKDKYWKTFDRFSICK